LRLSAVGPPAMPAARGDVAVRRGPGHPPHSSRPPRLRHYPALPNVAAALEIQ
jgi:hypothetical protein